MSVTAQRVGINRETPLDKLNFGEVQFFNSPEQLQLEGLNYFAKHTVSPKPNQCKN